jgi:CO/xanthine dehydrogenase Mo-binding subunit/CTP:molybdopterin cytidylyltransferase MocA
MKPDAVILAAGLSSRAGANKLLFPLGGRTVIEASIEPFLSTCGRIIVVGGARFEELKSALARLSPGVEVVLNDDYLYGMFSSVKAGIRRVGSDRFFIHPGDCPLVPASVPERLLSVRADIVLPVSGGRTGHPVLIDSRLIPEILATDAGSNLRAFIASHGFETVEVDSPGILLDIDTRGDLEKAERNLSREQGRTVADALARSVPKVDNPEKLSGRAGYIADMPFPGMLHAKTVRSTRPRARILSIRLPEMPGGYFTVDRNDIPGRNRVHVILDDQPVFAEETVNYIGEPIMLVVGPSKAKVLELASAVRIEYGDLAAVFTVEEAEASGAPIVGGENNRFAEYRYGRGEATRVIGEAASGVSGSRVFADEISTGYQEHVYLEPQGLVGLYDRERDRIEIHGSMQCPYYIRNALAIAFGWEPGRFRVVQTCTGGGFGGKEEYPSLLACQAAAAAYKTGKPVALILDRAEDIECTTKRHPARIGFRTAVDPEGRVTAMEVEVRLDAGASLGLSGVVLQRTMFTAPGVYRVPNLAVHGVALATNSVPAGAFRGFGAPQATMAIEIHMDHIASSLGMSPLEFRKRNMARKGDLTSTGGTYAFDVPLEALAERVIASSGYRAKRVEYASACLARGTTAACNGLAPLRGIGMSFFLHGCGFTGSGERDHIKAKVRLARREDGTVDILAANTDMGQGLLTTFRKIVASALGLPLERVSFEKPDTDRVPDSGPTVASRSIMIDGKLLEDAAIELKSRWDEPGEIVVERNYRHPDRIRWDDSSFIGDAYPTHSWGVNIVEVAVDPVSFEITVTGVWAAYDVGHAVDERIMRGQVEGGILQGLGYATIEVMEKSGGRLKQRTMTDYVIPTSLDAPPIESSFIDNPYPDGPMGAKGAGELPLVGAAPALASAVENALQARVSRIPLTPEYLMKAVRHAG